IFSSYLKICEDVLDKSALYTEARGFGVGPDLSRHERSEVCGLTRYKGPKMGVITRLRYCPLDKEVSMQGNTIKLGFHGATTQRLQTDVVASAHAGVLW